MTEVPRQSKRAAEATEDEGDDHESKKAYIERELKTFEFINSLRKMFRDDVVRAMMLWDLTDSRVREITRTMVDQNPSSRFVTLFANSGTMPDEIRQVIVKFFEESVKANSISSRAFVSPVNRSISATVSPKVPENAKPVEPATSTLTSSSATLVPCSQNFPKLMGNEIPYVPAKKETGDLLLMLSEIEVEFAGSPTSMVITYLKGKVECKLEKICANRYRVTVDTVTIPKVKKPSRGINVCTCQLIGSDQAVLNTGIFRLVSTLTLISRAKRAED